MKKAMQFALMAALIVSLSGCGNMNQPQAIRESSGIETVTSEIDENAAPKETLTDSFSESEASYNNSVIEAKTETESAQVENSQPADVQSPTTQTQQPAVSNDTPKPEPPKTVEPTPPPAEEKPTPKPTPIESPQESTPPEEPDVPDFNIDYWIGYARSYAESVGLRLESTAVDCWDNPITAGAYSACLDRDIESRLNRYSRDEDITDVWIWAQIRSDGSYDLYIGYA